MKSPRLAYLGYLCQSFLKRPFGYIISLLYVIYLALILLIIPKIMHFDPLFIWTIGGFNMPMFNLFFIGASAASIAVAVFRVSRDDGTELSLASKPITKNTMVLMKTLAYLSIMLIICILTLFITLLVYPAFGEYNEVSNITGTTLTKYRGLILSVFVGNIVNMLIFGGVAVFIAMVGGQVIIMIGTIGMVFLLFLMNFLFPQISKTATDILSDKYDTEILSYSCNTIHQYEHPEEDSTPLNFATIQCMTNDAGEEGIHYDTKEYWDRALTESGRLAFNYIDIGKQLSCLYSSFGLDDSRLKEASKLVIGSNGSFNYSIDETTHIDDDNNITEKNYPISYYAISDKQGKSFPKVVLIGADMTIGTNNWYLWSTVYKVDFNTLCYASTESESINISEEMWTKFQKPWLKLSELTMTDEQKQASKALFDSAIEEFNYATDIFCDFAREKISQDESGKFFPVGEFETLTPKQRFEIVSKINFHWAILAQQKQNEMIYNYAQSHGMTDEKFPFSSKAVLSWINNCSSDMKYNDFINRVFIKGIRIEKKVEGQTDSFSCLVTSSSINYAETFANLYQYTVTNFYSINAIVVIWSIISGVLFASAILVYKKTDIK